MRARYLCVAGFELLGEVEGRPLREGVGRGRGIGV